ncbi:MAG: NifB/NifX family molybdenum-iron cluster-binding protein [Phycisphaerae bacterium]|nr:NifB/NifX family molybdenum-iron cluster-binding protein [Phycisphaerae bacterium]
MSVAVPVFQNRVSPVFDTCQQVLVFEDDAEGRLICRAVDFSSVQEARRAERLRDLGVDVLLCGGITQMQAHRVSACGIQLVPWVAGEVDEVMSAYRKGGLPDPRFAMPGCGRRRRGQGGRGQCGRGRGWGCRQPEP